MVENCEDLAHLPGEERWVVLCAPSTSCLEILSGVRPRQCSVGPDLLDSAGVGPNALIKRLLIHLMEAHVSKYRCTPQSCSIPLLRDIWSKALGLHHIEVSVDVVSSVICYPCPSCGRLMNSDVKSDHVRSLLLGLLAYVELSSRNCNK